MITIIKVALYWSQLIKDGEILVQPGFEPATSHSCMISTPEHSPNWANQAVVKWNLLAGVDSICFFFPTSILHAYAYSKQILLKYPPL